MLTFLFLGILNCVMEGEREEGREGGRQRMEERMKEARRKEGRKEGKVLHIYFLAFLIVQWKSGRREEGSKE